MINKNCILCDSNDQEIYIKHQNFEIMRCNNCGLYYQYAPKQFETLENIYNNIYEEESRVLEDKWYENKKMNICHKDIVAYHKEPGNLLDIGCSYGLLMEYFIKKKWQVTGIDISKNAINYAKSKGLNCYNTNVENFVPERKFDVIVMSHVLEHLEKPIESLKIIKEWLLPAGIIYIRVPNVDSRFLPSIYQNFLGELKPFEHLFYFSKTTLNLLLEKVGLKSSIKTDTRIDLGDALNCYFRAKFVLKKSWQNLNYRIDTKNKKRYLFAKHAYGEIISLLNNVPIGPKNREIVAVASLNDLVITRK